MAATAIDTLLVRIEADLSGLRRDLKRVERQTEQSGRKVQQATKKMDNGFSQLGRTLRTLGPLIATGFGAAFVRGVIRTGSEVENLRIRMNTLFGSVEEGTRAFESLTTFASKVPFSLQEIQQGAGSLSAVAKNAEELNELLVITGNISANFGIPFAEASMNVQRALSAGAGAADQFRDRGVLAFAGFQAGASYSASETARVLQETFGTGGKTDGAMDQLAGTFTGSMSMLGDAVFNFQRQISDAGLLGAVTDLVKELTTVTNDGQSFAQMLGGLLTDAVRGLTSAIQFCKENIQAITVALAAFITVKAIAGIIQMSLAFVQMARSILAARAAMALLNTIAKRTPVGIIAAILAVTAAELGAVDAVLDRVNSELAATGDEIEDLDNAASTLERTMDDNVGSMTNLANSIVDLSASVGGGTEELTDYQKAFQGLRDRTIAASLALAGYSDEVIAALKASGQFEHVQINSNGIGVLPTNGYPELGGQTGQPMFPDRLTSPQLELLEAEARAAELAEQRLEERNRALENAQSLVTAALPAEFEYAQAMSDLQFALAQGAISGAEFTAARDALMQKQQEANPVLQEGLSIVEGMVSEEEQLKHQINAVTEAMNANIVSTTDGNNALGQLREKMRELNPMYKTMKEGLQQVGDSIADNIADALVEGKFALDDFKNIFKSFVKQIIAEAIRMFIVKKILSSAFGGFFGGGGSVPAATGAAGGGRLPRNGFRGFAGGGQAPILVGERGPELFVPQSAGSIKNNMDTRNILGNAGQPVVVQQTINVETGVSQTVRAEMLSLLPAIKQDTIQAVAEAKRRGGSFAQAFGG